MKKSRYEYPVPERQADAVLNQANPGDGTEYEVLATTRNVRIYSISVQCTWTVQPTPLQIHITIDGQTITHSFTDPATATVYMLRRTGNDDFVAATTQSLVIATGINYLAFWCEGRSIRITAEITGGTVSNLSARVKYARW